MVVSTNTQLFSLQWTVCYIWFLIPCQRQARNFCDGDGMCVIFLYHNFYSCRINEVYSKPVNNIVDFVWSDCVCMEQWEFGKKSQSYLTFWFFNENYQINMSQFLPMGLCLKRTVKEKVWHLEERWGLQELFNDNPQINCRWRGGCRPKVTCSNVMSWDLHCAMYLSSMGGGAAVIHRGHN